MRKIPALIRNVFSVGLWALAGTVWAAPEGSQAGQLKPESKVPAQVDKWTDTQGNYYRRARSGHVTNYDENKVGAYVLPDPLVLGSGLQVADGETWRQQRRPELLELYRKEIYGRVPPNAPEVSFTVVETDSQALKGRAVHKVVSARAGDKPGGPVATLQLYLPSHASGRVPVLLHLLFGKPPSFDETPKEGATSKASEAGPIAEFLDRGYGYAMFRYTDWEPDGPSTPPTGVRLLSRAEPSYQGSGDDWGAISAWAWGASRMLDYLEKDPGVDATRIALIGHSRLGKTVLWAGAQDERFALIFSSCAGEMGSALARRDFGETVDDMAGSFGHQFARNFEKYIGHWNELPVDTHCLIALQAPRPVLITGGTQDQWADPRGEFLAEVAAGPIYRLLGKKDLGAAAFPAVDTPLMTGELGFLYHTGPHAITPSDWEVFLKFVDRYFQPTAQPEEPKR